MRLRKYGILVLTLCLAGCQTLLKPQLRFDDHQTQVVNMDIESDDLSSLVQVENPSDQTPIVEQPMIDESQLLTVSINEIKQTPIATMKDVPHNIGNLLGFNQTSTIMEQFNATLDRFDPLSGYDDLTSLTVPLIYPGLVEYFPEELDHLIDLLDLQLTDAERTNPNLIIVAKTPEAVGLAYYRDQKLTVLTSVSPGTTKTKTIEGKYYLTHDKTNYRSSMYGSPMPYAIRIKGPYFMHQSHVDGDYLSHGCVRVPGVYQKWLYENLPNKTLQKEQSIPAPMIIIHKPYTTTLLGPTGVNTL